MTDIKDWNAVDELNTDIDGYNLSNPYQHVTRKLMGAVKRKFNEVVNVKDFGAVGDGINDDTQAIQDAFSSSSENKSIYFPYGTYKCTSIHATRGFFMCPGAKILYGGTVEENHFIYIDSDTNFEEFGRIDVDCNNKQIRRVIEVSGDNNSFEYIRIKNLLSDTILATGVMVYGDANHFDSVVINDFIKGEIDNDSSPQGLTMGGSSDGNYCDSIYSRNARSTVVCASTGNNQFGTVASYDCKDNGFYATSEGGSAIVDTIIYDGEDASLGVRGCKVVIGQIIIRKFGGGYAIFFGNLQKCTIGSVIVDCEDSQTGNILGDNGHFPESGRQGCGEIRIGSISGNIGQSQILYLPEVGSDGDCSIEYLHVGSINVSMIYDPEQGSLRTQFMNLGACCSLFFGEVNISCKTNPADGTKVMGLTLPSNRLAGRARFGKFRFRQLTAAGADESDSTKRYSILVSGFVGNNLIEFSNGIVVTDTSNPNLDGNPRLYLQEAQDIPNDRLYATQAPTQGTWQKGSVLWNTSPTQSTIGWICSVAGTPGTWVAF